MELYANYTLNNNIDDRATFQVLNTKWRMCGADEKQPRFRKQQRLSLE